MMRSRAMKLAIVAAHLLASNAFSDSSDPSLYLFLMTFPPRISTDLQFSVSPQVSPLWFGTSKQRYSLGMGPFVEPTLLLNPFDVTLSYGATVGGQSKGLGLYLEGGERGISAPFWGTQIGYEFAGEPHIDNFRMGLYLSNRFIYPQNGPHEVWFGLNFLCSFNAFGRNLKSNHFAIKETFYAEDGSPIRTEYSTRQGRAQTEYVNSFSNKPDANCKTFHMDSLELENPVYPKSLLSYSTEGSADLLVTISKTGVVSKIGIIQSENGHFLFENAAKDAILKSKYTVASCDSLPVERKFRKRFDFKMKLPNRQ